MAKKNSKPVMLQVKIEIRPADPHSTVLEDEEIEQLIKLTNKAKIILFNFFFNRNGGGRSKTRKKIKELNL